jgi:Tfp pilus assembly protein PilN
MPESRRQRKALRRRLRSWAGGLLAYGLALALGYLLCGRYVNLNSRDLSNEMLTAGIEVNSAKKVLSAVDEEWASTGQQLRAVNSIGRQPDWSGMLALLSENLPDSAVLNHCRMHMGEPSSKTGKPAGEEPAKVSLQLAGLAKAQSDVSDYVLRLERTGVFDKVRLIKQVRQPFLDGTATAFSLECTMAPQARATQ